MRHHSARIFWVWLATFALFTLQIPNASACGPFFEQAVMVHTAHPDLPLSEYAGGNLGIVRPRFARSYLAIAYRYLNDKPLDAAEKSAALALWNFRLRNDYEYKSKALDEWLTARKAFIKAQSCDIDQWRTLDTDTDYWQSYLNCPDDAFNTAIATLKARIAKYGQTSPVIKDWIKAQDLVFCHCGSPRYDFDTKKRDPEPAFPEAAPSSADALTKADRAYQIAAAHFYAQQFDQALSEFGQIAADTQSPWSVWAPYLMARTLTRQATTAQKTDMQALAKADTQVNAVLANPALSVTHAAAKKLKSFIEVRLFPEKYLHVLADRIRNGGDGATLQNDLMDYTILYDNLLGLTADADITSLTYSKLPNSVKEDDLSDWIATFQSTDDAARTHAQERYAATHTAAWLAAWLDKLQAGSADSKRALDAVAGLQPTSQNLTSLYRAAQLLNTTNPAQAKVLLDNALRIANLPPSSRNLLLDERTRYATTLKEFLSLSVRIPALVSSDWEGNELPDDFATLAKMQTFVTSPKVLAPLAAEFFNWHATMAQYLEATTNTALPPPVRNNITQAAWTRAYLLNDQKSLVQLTPRLRQAFPQMSTYLTNFENLDLPARKFAGAYLLLHFPGMRPYVNWGLQRLTPIARIDDYQENWWAADPKAWPSTKGAVAADDYKEPVFPAALKTGGTADLAKLKALPAAATLLSREAVAWAKSHPSDPRVPEALSLAVKATKFGPQDSQTSPLSKQAFVILHHSYPSSPWTKKTPYYY